MLRTPFETFGRRISDIFFRYHLRDEGSGTIWWVEGIGTTPVTLGRNRAVAIGRVLLDYPDKIDDDAGTSARRAAELAHQRHRIVAIEINGTPAKKDGTTNRLRRMAHAELVSLGTNGWQRSLARSKNEGRAPQQGVGPHGLVVCIAAK